MLCASDVTGLSDEFMRRLSDEPVTVITGLSLPFQAELKFLSRIMVKLDCH